jgi:hypothetical protein
VHVRDGDGLWQDWQTNATSALATFWGTPGHTYCFRSRAWDQAGNVGPWFSSPDACTTVEVFFSFVPLVLRSYVHTLPPSSRYPNDPGYDSQ